MISKEQTHDLTNKTETNILKVVMVYLATIPKTFTKHLRATSCHHHQANSPSSPKFHHPLMNQLVEITDTTSNIASTVDVQNKNKTSYCNIAQLKKNII